MNQVFEHVSVVIFWGCICILLLFDTVKSIILWILAKRIQVLETHVITGEGLLSHCNKIMSSHLNRDEITHLVAQVADNKAELRLFRTQVNSNYSKLFDKIESEAGITRDMLRREFKPRAVLDAELLAIKRIALGIDDDTKTEDPTD